MSSKFQFLGAIIVSLSLYVPVHSEPHSSKGNDQVKRGRHLVHKNKCSICHALNGKGGKLASPMNGITEGKTDSYLKGSLLDPKTTIGPKTTMPAYKFSEAELDAVIEFMKRLKTTEEQ